MARAREKTKGKAHKLFIWLVCGDQGKKKEKMGETLQVPISRVQNFLHRLTLWCTCYVVYNIYTHSVMSRRIYFERYAGSFSRCWCRSLRSIYIRKTNGPVSHCRGYIMISGCFSAGKVPIALRLLFISDTRSIFFFFLIYYTRGT